MVFATRAHLFRDFSGIVQFSPSIVQLGHGGPVMATLHLTLRLRHTRQALEARERVFFDVTGLPGGSTG